MCAIELVGLAGFEPASIAPETLQKINWTEYKEHLLSKYAKGYAIQLFENAQKYNHLLKKVKDVQLIKPTVRNNIIKALIALSRYQGTYETFKNQMTIQGIKYVRPDPITAFTRIFNSNTHEGLEQWYNQAKAVLCDNERLYLRFMLLSGIRAMEGINSFNLIANMRDKYTTEYYNEKTGFLEHFRYPKLFLRNSKNCYVSYVPKSLLDEISKSNQVSYIAIDKRLNRAELPMRMKQLRSFYATKMREQGLLSEQIDLMQGRVGKSVFLHHYFKADPLQLSKKILEMLPKLEESFI